MESTDIYIEMQNIDTQLNSFKMINTSENLNQNGK